MDKETIDLSNVHILALYRQYYGITLAQWRFNHDWYDGRIDISAKEFNEQNEELSESVKVFFDEINKRLNLNEEDENFRDKFMAWYNANASFIKSLSDEDYDKFAQIERDYLKSDFKDSTEFNAVLGELKYEEFVAEQLKDTGVTAGL